MTYFLKLIAACFCLAAASMLQLAHADADNWQLSEPKGIVRVMLPGAAITKGRDEMSLPAGTVITTGRDSAAVMVRGSQRIEIAADARLTVSENADGFTRIRQDTGAAYYQVDSRAMPHFRVDTTLLAAVVKGTGFTVSAGPDAHVVHVAHGLVEVRANQGQGVSDVRPGETARVERASPLDLKLEVPKEASAGPKAINIPAIDYANASNNLLQPFSGPADTGRNNGASNGSSARGQNGLAQDNSANAQQNANATANLAALNGPANAASNASGKGAVSENGSGNGGGSENGNENGGGSENGNGNGGGSENGNENGGGSENGNGNGGGSENGNGNGGGSENGNGNGGGSENGNGNGGGSENGNGNGGGSENGNGNGGGSENGNGGGSENGNGGGDLPTPPPRGPKR